MDECIRRLNVCRACVNYYELGYMFQKNCTSSKLERFLDTASKFALFSVSGLKDEKLLKTAKPTWKLKHANYSKSLLNISAKCHQNWSLQFRAIPIQIWCFLRHCSAGSSSQWDIVSSTPPRVDLIKPVSMSVRPQRLFQYERNFLRRLMSMSDPSSTTLCRMTRSKVKVT